MKGESTMHRSDLMFELGGTNIELTKARKMVTDAAKLAADLGEVIGKSGAEELANDLTLAIEEIARAEAALIELVGKLDAVVEGVAR